MPAPLPPPVDLDATPGGEEAFGDAVSDVLVLGTLLQRRFSEHLDLVGTPGRWRCDPHTGELELRGHTFAAQMLGSWADTWLFAWANTNLTIVDAMTTKGRALGEVGRRIGVPALALAHLSGNTIGSHPIGLLAVGHGLGSAYYVCEFPSNDAVYLVLDPIAAQWPKLYELQRAGMDAMQTDLLVDPVRSFRFAAAALGLEVRDGEGAVEIRDGADELTIALDGEGRIVKIESNVRL